MFRHLLRLATLAFLLGSVIAPPASSEPRIPLPDRSMCSPLAVRVQSTFDERLKRENLFIQFEAESRISFERSQCCQANLPCCRFGRVGLMDKSLTRHPNSLLCCVVDTNSRCCRDGIK